MIYLVDCNNCDTTSKCKGSSIVMHTRVCPSYIKPAPLQVSLLQHLISNGQVDTVAELLSKAGLKFNTATHYPGFALRVDKETSWI